MKFEIGKVIQWGKDSVLAINFPGVGIVCSVREEINGDVFDYVTLDRVQLKKLRNVIQKKLRKNNGKESNME